MSIVRITRKRLAVSSALSQMACFSFVVDMVAASPRATLRGLATSPAAVAKDAVFSPSSAAVRLTELTLFAPTVVMVDASPRAVIGASVCGLFIPGARGNGSLVEFFMFIGFAVEVFKGAKFDVFQGANLAN